MILGLIVLSYIICIVGCNFFSTRGAELPPEKDEINFRLFSLCFQIFGVLLPITLVIIGIAKWVGGLA